jgi:hypothetical protein
MGSRWNRLRFRGVAKKQYMVIQQLTTSPFSINGEWKKKRYTPKKLGVFNAGSKTVGFARV